MVSQHPGQDWILSRSRSCQAPPTPDSRASPFVGPVPFSPLTGSDGYNPFLTTGEILGSGPDSDPARALGQTLCHRQKALGSHSCLALGFPLLGLDLLTVARVPQTHLQGPSSCHE